MCVCVGGVYIFTHMHIHTYICLYICLYMSIYRDRHKYMHIHTQWNINHKKEWNFAACDNIDGPRGIVHLNVES